MAIVIAIKAFRYKQTMVYKGDQFDDTDPLVLRVPSMFDRPGAVNTVRTTMLADGFPPVTARKKAATEYDQKSGTRTAKKATARTKKAS